MFGFDDAAIAWLQSSDATDRQGESQNFNSAQNAESRIFNEQEARKARSWMEDMSNTAHQREQRDLTAAGLNPILSATRGGASTPNSAAAHAQGGGAGIAGSPGASISGSGFRDIEAAKQSASQIRVNDALEDKTRAEAAEVRARTPTHDYSIERTKQEITESVERIKKIQQDTNTSSYSAGNLYQQTQNLLEEIPRIKQTVQLLKAQTGSANVSIGKQTAEEGEIRQRMKENLPEIERIIKDIEARLQHNQLPGSERSAAVHDTVILGELAALVKAFGALMPNIGIIMRPKR